MRGLPRILQDSWTTILHQDMTVGHRATHSGRYLIYSQHFCTFRMVSKSISQHSELKTSGLKWITQASVQSIGKLIIGECTRPVKHGTDSDTKLVIRIWCSLAKHKRLSSIKRLNDDEIHTWKLLDRVTFGFSILPNKNCSFSGIKSDFYSCSRCLKDWNSV